jgi:hypothetical protein
LEAVFILWQFLSSHNHEKVFAFASIKDKNLRNREDLLNVSSRVATIKDNNNKCW